MIIRSIFASVALVTSISATAAPEWKALPGSNADHTFLDSNSFLKQDGMTDVAVLRNFNKSITLGNDPETGAEMYSHRSVKLTYRVDCAKDAIAVSEWKMFEGNLGHGEVVWADQSWGKLAYTAANDDETRFVLRSACDNQTAMR